MLQHYLKIAIRNLLKYRTQNIISIVGLAVGFTFFALSTLWIRYEMTYDDFHEGAERIYLIRAHNEYFSNGISNTTPWPLSRYLKSTFPEIETTGSIRYSERFLRQENVGKVLSVLGVDSAAVSMFDIKVIAGNANFMNNDSHEIGITKDLAKELFGDKNPLGEELDLDNRKYKVCAIVSSWSKHSNIPYQIVSSLNAYDSWKAPIVTTFIRTRPQIDITVLEKKLTAINLSEIDGECELGNLTITPLGKVRYSDYHKKENIVVSFQYILYFCLIGFLIIICSLFNYLILFVNRIKMRSREMALRKVCGASNTSLFNLYSIEMCIILFIALLVGMIIIELCNSAFIHFTRIEISSMRFYFETISYLIVVILITFITVQIPISHIGRRALISSLQKNTIKISKNISFRKSSLILQLIISILFLFTTIVMLKQIHYLKHTDTHLNQQNVGSVALWMNGDINTWTDKIGALPMVTEVLPPQYFPLVSTGPMMYFNINDWTDKMSESPQVDLGIILAKQPFFEFYHFQLLEGEWLTEKNSSQDVIINETAVKKFGWQHPIGKQFQLDKDTKYTIIGVVKDFRYVSPTTPTPPICFVLTDKQKYLWFRASILFKYQEGTWNECRKAIETMHKEDYPSSALRLFNEEEEYDKHLKSENSLIQLLSIASVVCMLISAFGIFSFVTLCCEQRRKEIAIRKVNGATIKSIIGMFTKEYSVMLLIASIIAFPIGYILMRRWLEDYIEQTSINFWIYLAIFIGIAFIITASIGWRIWQAARQNPAEVIKGE